nr:unnamed protein product [Callosobruchus chinensis]
MPKITVHSTLLAPNPPWNSSSRSPPQERPCEGAFIKVPRTHNETKHPEGLRPVDLTPIRNGKKDVMQPCRRIAPISLANLSLVSMYTVRLGYLSVRDVEDALTLS